MVQTFPIDTRHYIPGEPIGTAHLTAQGTNIATYATLAPNTLLTFSRNSLPPQVVHYQGTNQYDATLDTPGSIDISLPIVPGVVTIETSCLFGARVQNYYKTYDISSSGGSFYSTLPYFDFSAYADINNAVLRFVTGIVSKEFVELKFVFWKGTFSGFATQFDLYNISFINDIDILLSFPGEGGARTYHFSDLENGVLRIPSVEAKSIAKSTDVVTVSSIKAQGYDMPWIPLRFAPFADVVVSSESGSYLFSVNTTGSYDLDDGIVTRRFNIKIGATVYNVTSAAMETSSEVFKFVWDDLRQLTGLELPENVAVQFEFIVTDAGGLSDTATFSVVAPESTMGLQIGAVQSASGRLTFATIESGAMKIRGGQLNGAALKLDVLDTVQSASSPGLGIKRDNSIARSYRTQAGEVTLERSNDGGTTWQ